jgi:hypothetical protein
MLPVVWAMLSVAPELVKEGGESAGFHSEIGGTQGFPPTPIFFCIALHPHVRAAEKRLKEHADWSVVRAQIDDAYLAGPVAALDEGEEGLRADLVDAGLRLDRANWLTYAEPAVRMVVTHVRNAQGLEPWAWVAVSVQRGGVISFASVDGLEEEKEGDRAVEYGWMPYNASFGFLDLTPSILLLRQFWD